MLSGVRWSRLLWGLVVGLFSSTLWAGEWLHFKIGDVDPLQYSEQQQQSVGPLRASDNQHFIIQFWKMLEEEDQEFINTHVDEVVRYIPDDAVMVSGEEVQDLIVLNPRIRAIIPYDKQFRISPDLDADYYDPQEWLHIEMYLFESADALDVEERLQKFEDITDVEASGRFVTAYVRFHMIDQIAGFAEVEYISPYVEVDTFVFDEQPLDLPAIQTDEEKPEPELSVTGYETGTKVMRFEAAWERGFHGEDQFIGMADTGLDRGSVREVHPDFLGLLVSGAALGRRASWADYHGHGTHVASSAMGAGVAWGGEHSFQGGAYKSKIHAQSIAGGWGLAPPRNLNDLFAEAYKHGVRIHTNSWGGMRGGKYSASESQVDEFMWKHPDFLILFAAGNAGFDSNRDGRVDLRSMASPASAKNIITVGASENYLTVGGRQEKMKDSRRRITQPPLAEDKYSDNPNGIAMFSSRGPTADGRIKPDLVAPGTNIVGVCSTQPGSSKLWGAYPIDKNYCYSGGTSMSTPLAAGAAAVVRQALQVKTQYKNPSAALIKAVMLATADDLFPGQFGEGPGQEMLEQAPNNQQGYGRINMDKATDLDSLRFLDEPDGVEHGRVLVYEVPYGINKVTLVYTDAPAAPSVSRALVNDLDLYVKLPSGEVLEGASQVNNTEQIKLPQVTHGVRVYVKGYRITNGHGSFFRNRVPFALVANTK